VMNQLYPNDMGMTPGGPPWYFYCLYLLVKVPVPLLAAFGIGLIEIFRKRCSGPGNQGYFFLRLMLVFWLLPMPLLGAKFLRYTLSLMPFFYMTAAVGAVVVWHALERSNLSPLLRRGYRRHSTEEERSPRRLSRLVPAALVIALFIALPAMATVFSLPFPSAYTNVFGARRTGYYFPHDEFYDAGARESIHYIAKHAPECATVATEIPETLEIYLEQYGRLDIHSEIISHPDSDLVTHRPDYVLFQPGRIYYENRKYLEAIASRLIPVQTSYFGNVVAAEVFDFRTLASDASNVSDGPYNQ
jgi:hypothetical protein